MARKKEGINMTGAGKGLRGRGHSCTKEGKKKKDKGYKEIRLISMEVYGERLGREAINETREVEIAGYEERGTGIHIRGSLEHKVKSLPKVLQYITSRTCSCGICQILIHE